MSRGGYQLIGGWTGAGLSPAQVDELVRLHLHHPMILQGHYTPLTNGDPAALVTELLRLARLGAVAEAEVDIDPTTLNRTVVSAMRSRWDREIGAR